MSCRRTSVLGVVLLIAVACDAARAIDVQVPSSTTLAGPGQTGSVAVSIAPLVAQDMVLSGALSFTYAAGVATATAATPTALLAGCTTTTNLTPGMVTLIFACTVPLSSGGTLFDVAFQGVAVGVSPLSFAPTNEIPNGCLLNEGTPACQTSNGELVVGAPPPTGTATATPSGVATPTAPPSGGTPTATASPTGTIAPGSSGVLVQDVFRASDGTAYQLARVLPAVGPGEAVRVTTLAGSTGGVGGCASTGASAGTPADAVVGTIPPQQSLSPYAEVMRTAVLVPSAAAVASFDAGNGGRLHLGTGPGALTVCASPIDCAGQPGVVPLVDLGATGNAAAACVAQGLATACDGPTQRDAFAFGLPGAGSPPLCTAAATTATVVCAPEPGDGFRLLIGQAIVFVYGGDLAASGFGVGIAGFAIDLDGANPAGCAAGEVVAATALVESQPAPPFPTATGTATATAPPSPTRPAIPVVASPIGGPGLFMIGGLATVLLFALRARAAR